MLIDRLLDGIAEANPTLAVDYTPPVNVAFLDAHFCWRWEASWPAGRIYAYEPGELTISAAGRSLFRRELGDRFRRLAADLPAIHSAVEAAGLVWPNLNLKEK